MEKSRMIGTFLLPAMLLVGCGKATLTPLIPESGKIKDPVYTTGAVTGTFNGQPWTMKGGEARVVAGMDPGTRQLEVILWEDGSRPACVPGKSAVIGKEMHIVVNAAAGETHVVGINPDGAMVNYQYKDGNASIADFASEAYVFIQTMDGAQVVGKVTSGVKDTYKIGGEYTVTLCP